MGDDLDGVIYNIRALLISSKEPIPIRSLSRDYETIVGNPIPYRSFKYNTLESFLQSTQSLRVTGSGRDLFVDAARDEASSHISKMVSKQKTSSKRKDSFPPRRGGYSQRGGYARSRGYAPRHMPRESSAPSTSRHNSYPYTSNQPKEYPSKNEDHKQLVVKLGNGDTRQVSLEGAYNSAKHNNSSQKEPKSSYVKPPRFQKIQQPSTEASSTKHTSSINNITKDLEETLFLDRPREPDPRLREIDTNIISALKPSQLIAAGRAKQQAAQSQLGDLYLQGALGDFNQVQGPLVPSQGEPALLVAVPTPDETNLANNVHLLLQYALAKNWCVPEYSVFPRKPKGTRQCMYGSMVKISETGQDVRKYSSYPNEDESASVAKGYAAKRALEDLLKEEKVKLQQTIISTDPNMIKDRVSKIVAGVYNGMFANNVEDLYIEQFKEQLPSNWLQSLSNCPTLSVESVLNNSIIIPTDPVVMELDLNEPLLTSVPLALIPPDDDTWDVFVTSATSTCQVWLRLIGENYSERFEELLTKMELFYKTYGLTELALNIEEGQYYAASSHDGWFRVCVNEVKEDTKTVDAWLIDHGDSDIFAFNNLYRLPSEFCTLPKQALQCSLEGLDGCSEDPFCCEVLSSCDYLIGKSLIAKVNSRDKETGSVKVTLFDTSGTDDVNINEKIRDSFTLDFGKDVPRLPEEGRAMEVSVSHISKRGEVFIQIPNMRYSQMVELLETLGTDEINTHKLTSYRQVKLNKIYLAQYSKDENWYRAVVTATPSVQQNKLALQFVDFGNTETASITDIAEVENLPPLIGKLPPQAVKVSLNNLPLERLSNSQIAKLHSLLLGENKVVLIKLVTIQNDLPIVDVFYKDDSSTGRAIVSVNLTIALEADMLRSENKNDSNKALSNQHTNGNDAFYSRLKRPKFDDDNYHAVKVLLSANPGNFTFQLKKYGKELDNLMVQLQHYYDSMSLPELKKEEIYTDGLYAALHNGDNNWYRVVVTGAMMGSSLVGVRLCDFGDMVCVPLSNLRKLESEFCEKPFMAMKGRLAGVAPSHTDWSVDDCIRFQELVVEKQLFSFIVKIDDKCRDPMDMVVSIQLIDTSSNKDIHIADILCNERRAVRSNET